MLVKRQSWQDKKRQLSYIVMEIFIFVLCWNIDRPDLVKCIDLDNYQLPVLLLQTLLLR